MKIVDSPEVSALRRQKAIRMRKDTERSLTEAIRQGINPRLEYARLVASLQCRCEYCRCESCGILIRNCNAA